MSGRGAHPHDGGCETDRLNGIADEIGSPDAIVAHAGLHGPGLDERLAPQAGRRRVVGMRHIVNRCPRPHATGLAVRRYGRSDVAARMWRLADHGLSCDFHGLPPQLAGLTETAARHPAVPLVVNHLGLADLTDGPAA